MLIITADGTVNVLNSCITRKIILIGNSIPVTLSEYPLLEV
jgi:hypothetical protein